MHIHYASVNDTILNGDNTFLAKVLLERLNPDKWPFSIRDLPVGSALVGGAIRDALLNRLSDRPDLDLIVPKHAIKITESFAKKLDATCVVLDADRDIARLVFEGWTIDIATQIGCSLEEDLCRRDFRLNAIALKLNPCSEIVDPTGGVRDLYQKRIVAVHEQNLVQDPLRLLRGLRLMAELNLFLDPQTRTFINTHAHLLSNSAPERIQSELQRIVSVNDSEEVIKLIKEIGLLRFWVNQSKPFRREIFVNEDKQILSSKELSIALPLARLTDLLSDSGLVNLRFSRKQCKRCKLLRKWERRKDGVAFETLEENERLELHQDLGEDLPALILQLDRKDQEVWIKRWRDVNDPLFHPYSPLDGTTLQQILGLSAGPQIGALMHHLCHERAFGRLNNRDTALKEARKWLQHNSTLL